MFFGSVCAIIHGISLPGQLIIFGLLVDDFVKFQTNEVKRLSNITITDEINIEDRMLFFAEVRVN